MIPTNYVDEEYSETECFFRGVIGVDVKVTLGLCVKNSEKIVKTALDSVAKQNFPHRMMKLTVVDDGSTDKTLTFVRDFVSKMDIKTVILCSGGKGLGVSRQIVVDNSEGDYIVWIDDDFVLKKDFIRNHVEFMEKNPSVGAAQANHIPTKETLVGTLESIGLLLVNQNELPETIGTGGSIFRLKAIKGIGGFDTNIIGAYEDVDISYRIKKSGWALSRNSSTEFYEKYPPTTLRALWNRYFWYGYGEHFFFHKYKTQIVSYVFDFVFDAFPPFATMLGFKKSCRIYQLTHNKRVFLLAFLYFFRSIACFLGSIRAHLDGYGHIASNAVRLP